MDHLIKLYLNPPKNLLFFDECPGIQILKRLVPDLRTDETMKRLEEFEYIRNGTMNVLAFFDYANGKVHAECQADHKTDTFLAIFKRHVSFCPANEQIHYVMDNLSTHRGYPFCKAVAELSAIDCPSEKELNNLEKLFTFLQSQEATIRNSIMNEEGPLKKENAENALNSLFSTLEDYLWQNTRKAA